MHINWMDWLSQIKSGSLFIISSSVVGPFKNSIFFNSTNATANFFYISTNFSKKKKRSRSCEKKWSDLVIIIVAKKFLFENQLTLFFGGDDGSLNVSSPSFGPSLETLKAKSFLQFLQYSKKIGQCVLNKIKRSM